MTTHDAADRPRAGRARSVYVASAEGHTGKSLVAVGLVELLARRVERLGVFRPVIRSVNQEDELVGLLVSRGDAGRPFESSVGVTYDDVHADSNAALATIVDCYQSLARSCDAVVIVGSDYTDIASPTELSFNARVAANLDAPVILVVSALRRSPDDVAHVVAMAGTELDELHATTVGVVANRCDPDEIEAMRARLAALECPAWAVPDEPLLAAPLLTDVMAALDGHLLFGDPEMLEREAEHMLVCGMNVEHILERLCNGQLCVAAGDRPDVLVALCSAHATEGFPTLAGVVLNGGFRPGPVVERLVKGLAPWLPIIMTERDSFQSAHVVGATRGGLGRGTQRKIDTALAAFEAYVPGEDLLRSLDVPRSPVMTPLMFEAVLIDRARRARRHIVLPEGDDGRILRAASTLLSRQVVELTLLGVESKVHSHAASLGLDLRGARVIDPGTSELAEQFAVEYARRRSHRGVALEEARDIIRGVSYFGTMMVEMGHSDGMVSGAAHSTAHTITPAFEIIKTAPGVKLVSSVFFMCLADRVLVYGDCAVNPDPDAEELAGIAIASADTAAQFGIEPRVAMLSYSTGTSGTGADVDKVRAATELVQARRPDLPVAGPLQYDAAVDVAVAAAKLPGSEVAGRATVFVFPDLNTGNNTYKAVQRTAGAVAIGPVLQGLRKPVNDLSRGATVRDIVNTVAITAAQADGAAVES